MFTENDIFNHLFKVALGAKDPDGVVTACLVNDNEILLSSPSAEDGVRHAEDLIIEKAIEKKIVLADDATLYTTLEPCSHRNPIHKLKDCTSIIIESGIKKVVFGAKDPNFSEDAKHRFLIAGVKYEQTKNTELIKRSLEIFNGTITNRLTYKGGKRKISLRSQK